MFVNPTSTSRFIKPLQSCICSCSNVVFIQSAGRRWTAEDCVPPARYDDLDIPDAERLLKPMPRGPDVPPVDRRRKAALTRGPCQGEKAQFMHGDFGIIALKGGWFKHCHFNVLMLKINRFIRNKPIFAKWRLEAPYHPVTKHPIQAVMGGGKGSIDHYVTPLKSRQVIVELGGKAQFVEVYPTLRNLAMLLPMPALAVSREMLEDMYEEERRIEEENENFFTFRELIEKNMQGIGTKVSLYDYRQMGRMR